MRRILVLGFVLLGVFGLGRFVTAQDEPAKPAGNPFEGGAKVEQANKRSADPVIKLAKPPGPEATLEERLEAKGTFHVEELPLKEFVVALEGALDTSVVLATKKLEEAAINVETPVTYTLKNVRMKTALRLILGELGLTYVFHDNVLMITTPEDAGVQLVTRVYDCRDLMKLPSPVRKAKRMETGRSPSEIGAPGIPAKGPEKKDEIGPDGGYDVSDLIEAITGTIASDSWDNVGGPGSISDFKGLVTMTQTQEVHEQIESLLNMLHKAGGLEEKVKVSR
jgi:general secretion pathway protein D